MNRPFRRGHLFEICLKHNEFKKLMIPISNNNNYKPLIKDYLSNLVDTFMLFGGLNIQADSMIKYLNKINKHLGVGILKIQRNNKLNFLKLIINIINIYFYFIKHRKLTRI